MGDSSGRGEAMSGQDGITRRAVLRQAAGAAAVGVLAGASPAFAGGRTPPPLWRTAFGRGLIYGSSYSTRLQADAPDLGVVNPRAALPFTPGGPPLDPA